MSFTPGPWGVLSKDRVFPSVYDGMVIITVVYDPGDGDIAVIPDDYPAGAWANARLIAAAPEMLEALEEAIPVLTDAIEDSYCGMHLGRGLCDCKSDIVARISTIIARIKETPNA